MLNQLLSWLLEFQQNFLAENLNEIYDRLNLLLQEKQAGINSDLINQESVAINDKLFGYKCLSEKQYKQLLIKSNVIYK